MKTRIVWNERSARWFKNASEYTGYNRKLAEILLKHIPSRTSLCDLGCGTALIDFELAPHFESVECVDISQDVVKLVDREISESGLTNMKTRCVDYGELTEKWDTVISLFNGGEDFFRDFFPMARETLVYVIRSEARGSFGPEKRRENHRFTCAKAAQVLDDLGVKYHLEEVVLEHGQPFADLDDAKAFVQAYALPSSDEEIDDYLDRVLVRTGFPELPYYLPKEKPIGIFIIKREDNAHIDI